MPQLNKLLLSAMTMEELATRICEVLQSEGMEYAASELRCALEDLRASITEANKIPEAEYFRDKYTFSNACRVDGIPDAQIVWIKIGNQYFWIDGYQDSKEEADWMRLMIGKAFVTLIEDSNHFQVKPITTEFNALLEGVSAKKLNFLTSRGAKVVCVKAYFEMPNGDEGMIDNWGRVSWNGVQPEMLAQEVANIDLHNDEKGQP